MIIVSSYNVLKSVGHYNAHGAPTWLSLVTGQFISFPKPIQLPGEYWPLARTPHAATDATLTMLVVNGFTCKRRVT